MIKANFFAIFRFDYQKNSSHTELTYEELSPFIEHILANSSNWCVQVCCLFMRTKLETSSIRRMERALMQLEVSAILVLFIFCSNLLL